jgi:TrmH family RNA methyltransferase
MQTASNRTLIRIVQSRQNRRVKELRAGLARGTKSDHGCIALEGQHLLEEALRSGLRVQTVFLRSGSERALSALRELFATHITNAPDPEILELPPDIFLSAVVTESPQGLAALVEAPEFSWPDLLRTANPLVLVCAGIQDPGNLGTLVRSAEAFGAAGVVALPGTVSLWNAKALRASAGSAFRLPLISASADEAFSILRKNGILLLAATVAGGACAAEIDLSGPAALLVGNEGSGLPEGWIAHADRRISISYPGPVESLNAAIAGSVLLYEAARQRSLAENASRPHRTTSGIS